jgi:hypothetical protein
MNPQNKIDTIKPDLRMIQVFDITNDQTLIALPLATH